MTQLTLLTVNDSGAAKVEPVEPVYPRWYTPRKGRPKGNRRVLLGLHPLAGAQLGPLGSRCGNCADLVERGRARSYVKCRHRITRSAATDVCRTWRGCKRFRGVILSGPWASDMIDDIEAAARDAGVELGDADWKPIETLLVLLDAVEEHATRPPWWLYWARELVRWYLERA